MAKNKETVEATETTETVKATETTEKDYKALVKYKAHKDKFCRDDIVVSVNGKTWIIKRGVEVEIPLYVKLAIENSEAQDIAAEEYIERNESKD